MEETLQQLLTEHGAEWGTVAGERVALHYGDIQFEHGYLTESVALIDLTARGCLAVLGDDRVKFINGQVTNDCLLYTSPSPRDQRGSRMPSSA